MRTAFDALGTVVSLDADELTPRMLRDARRAIDRIDELFSLYRPDAELARVAAGTLTLAETSAPVRLAYQQAHEWSAATFGAFTAHRPDGVLDLSGIAKALAIADAGAVLERANTPRWVVTIGGDCLASGGAVEEGVVAGVVDPRDRASLLCALALSDPRRAIATSGSAERGDHIWRLPGTPSDVLQATVVADDIVSADVIATAVVAGGRDLVDALADAFDVDVLVVTSDDGLIATPGIRSALRSPVGSPSS